MPKGRSKKGSRRCFTNFEELEEQRLKEEKKKAWREKKEIDSDEDDVEEEEEEEEDEKEEEDKSESESEDSEEEKTPKPKGLAGLIEIENPNRVVKKHKKISNLSEDTPIGKPELSRREREQLERKRMQELHAAGKSREAKADLERLAIIRKQREEAMQKKEELKKAKEAAAAAKKEEMSKHLKKKGKN